MSLEEIIKAKDLQISELLAEIQLLKEQQSITNNLDNLEVVIDSNEITESVPMTLIPNDKDIIEGEERQGGGDIMNLLSSLMGESNPFSEIMQQMMSPEADGKNPFSEIMQQMMSPEADGKNPLSEIMQQMMSPNKDKESQ